jgi:hypothetical protein
MSNNNWAIIGDVHSQSDKLKSALNYCTEHELRPILLGDIFDSQCSTSNSIEVHELLRNAQIHLNAIILQSNHQNKLIRFLQGIPVTQNHGLAKTIAEFNKSNIDSGELLQWLLDMPYVFIFKDNIGNEYRAAHAYIPSRISQIIEELNPGSSDQIEFHEKDFYETQKISMNLDVANPPIKTFRKLKEKMIYGPALPSEDEYKPRIVWWNKQSPRRTWTMVAGHYGVVHIDHDNKSIVLDGNCGKEDGQLPLYHLNERKLLMF